MIYQLEPTSIFNKLLDFEFSYETTTVSCLSLRARQYGLFDTIRWV